MEILNEIISFCKHFAVMDIYNLRGSDIRLDLTRTVRVLICSDPVAGARPGVNHSERGRIAAFLLQWPALGHCYW